MVSATGVGAWVSTLPFEVPFDPKDVLEHLTEHDSEVREGEKVVGALTEDQKLAWGILDRFVEAASRATIDFKHPRSSEAKAAARAQLEKNTAKAEAMKEIFWTMVRESFDLWDAPNIGIRSGSQVIKSERRESLLDVLEDLEELTHRAHRDSHGD